MMMKRNRNSFTHLSARTAIKSIVTSISNSQFGYSAIAYNWDGMAGDPGPSRSHFVSLFPASDS